MSCICTQEGVCICFIIIIIKLLFYIIIFIDSYFGAVFLEGGGLAFTSNYSAFSSIIEVYTNMLWYSWIDNYVYFLILSIISCPFLVIAHTCNFLSPPIYPFKNSIFSSALFLIFIIS